MSRRIAALDLGTNTFHLIIAEISGDQIQRVIYSDQKHVKLGEGGITEGTITKAAFNRGMEALSDFHQAIIQHEVELLRAVGTAALRTASNGLAFIQQIKANTGISIEIIDGELEATLIFQGVKQAVELTANSVIMDIGGGSVEFILADENGIKWKKSYPVGAARLMAQFHHSDPIAQIDIDHIKAHLDSTLKDLKEKSEEFKPGMLIGSAGAFETFAALSQIKSAGKPSELGKHFSFDIELLDLVLADILQSTHEERVANPAILSVRTDMIVVASVLTSYVIKELNLKSVDLSTFSLKEGLLVDKSMKW